MVVIKVDLIFQIYQILHLIAMYKAIIQLEMLKRKNLTEKRKYR